jgi:hypothetical protein
MLLICFVKNEPVDVSKGLFVLHKSPVTGPFSV